MKILLAAALVAGSVLLAPTSHADTDDSFVIDVHAAGISGSSSVLIHNGHAVCNKMDDGETPDGAVADILNGTGVRSTQLAATFVAISAKYYCPNHLFEHVHTGGTSTINWLDLRHPRPSHGDNSLPPADGSFWTGIIV